MASVPAPSQDNNTKSPCKYLAYNLEIGSP